MLRTIADIARQERAQATGRAQRAVVITNANLGMKAVESDHRREASRRTPRRRDCQQLHRLPLRPHLQPQRGSAGQAQAACPADARDEKWWREKFEAARTEIRRAENQVAVAQLELNAANRDYLTRSYDPDGRGSGSRRGSHEEAGRRQQGCRCRTSKSGPT